MGSRCRGSSPSSRGTEAVQSAGFIGVFPLVFASSVFADISPVTVSADAARALSIGGDAAGPVLQTLLWTIGILAVFIPLCVWRYRRMDQLGSAPRQREQDVD